MFSTIFMFMLFEMETVNFNNLSRVKYLFQNSFCGFGILYLKKIHILKIGTGSPFCITLQRIARQTNNIKNGGRFRGLDRA